METIDDFIIELQAISKDKRKLPLIIVCPNGLKVYPRIKMEINNLTEMKVTRMIIEY